MNIRARVARTLAAVGLATAGIVGSVAVAPPASADPIFPIDWNVDATTHIASLDLENTITGGSFVGSADLGTGAITGNLNLPASEISFELFGIGLADVGFAVAPTGPTTGTIDLSTLSVSMTSSFNIKIPYLRPLGIDKLNLVG
ncbi:MAG TPA: hypothetical protein VF015_08290, partial [Acidimicrobiales bacterium]